MPLVPRPRLLAAMTLGLALVAPPPAVAAAPRAAAPRCSVGVPGAAYEVGACLPDLTTAGTVADGHSDPAQWAGLQPAGRAQPDRRARHPDRRLLPRHLGAQHHARLEPRRPVRDPAARPVERRPRRRRHAGEPRAVRQRLHDLGLGPRPGYAYAATDKGNVGTTFYRDGRRPGDAVAEWNTRVTQLTRAAKAVVARRYGRAPRGPTRPGSPTAATWSAGSSRTIRSCTTAASTGRARCSARTARTCSPTCRRCCASTPRTRRATRPRTTRCSTAGLRARLGVPVAVPRAGLLGPDPADLPRGVRPLLRRRDRGRHAVLRESAPRRATPTTTTPPGRPRCTAPSPASR